MKHLLVTTSLLIAFSIPVIAQKLVVTDFIISSDVTASGLQTRKKDANGVICALIRVKTPVKKCSFVSPFIVEAQKKGISEYFVYLQEGTKKMEIQAEGFSPLVVDFTDYEITEYGVESKTTYVLNLEKVSENGSNLGILEVSTTPSDAEVILDNLSIGRTPLLYSYATPGKHNLIIRKGGFFDYESTIDVKEGKTIEIKESLSKSYEKEEKDGRTDFTINGVTFTMVLVRGGYFTMGATPEQKKPQADEGPAHNVTLRDFYIGETEVTQALWTAVMGSNPTTSAFKDSNMPVTMVSWDDCQKFIMKLRNLTGLEFRLPTEAEWEFSARGGLYSRRYMFSGGNNPKDVAWYKKNSGFKIHQVKTKIPNELGLYDMSGNVFEWCQDWYGKYSSAPANNPLGAETGEFKVYRGGCVSLDESYLRISQRVSKKPSFANELLGLRLCLSE